MTPPYNYPTFDADYVALGVEADEFDAFPNRLHVGDRAPGGLVTPLDGALDRTDPFDLAEIWRRDLAVIEFGSFT